MVKYLIIILLIFFQFGCEKPATVYRHNEMVIYYVDGSQETIKTEKVKIHYGKNVKRVEYYRDNKKILTQKLVPE